MTPIFFFICRYVNVYEIFVKYRRQLTEWIVSRSPNAISKRHHMSLNGIVTGQNHILGLLKKYVLGIKISRVAQMIKINLNVMKAMNSL